MSTEALRTVVQRSISDPEFRRLLATNADGALRGYDLTAAEIGALRSRDAGRLTAFGVDTRMSKVFTVDQGGLGNASRTSGDSAQAATVQTPDAAARNAAFTDTSASARSVQTPDAAARNAAFTDTSASARSVQTPDAAARNAAFTSGETSASSVQSPDAVDRNLAYTDTSASASSVQSPDAADRNLASMITGSEPRDTEPTWIGDNVGHDDLVVGGSEPHDVAPTWIGDDASPEDHASGGGIHQE